MVMSDSKSREDLGKKELLWPVFNFPDLVAADDVVDLYNGLDIVADILDLYSELYSWLVQRADILDCYSELI